MSDLKSRALDRAARAEDSPGARAHALAVLLRSAPLCEACGGRGSEARDSGGVTPQGQPIDVWETCTRCAGTGSPLRARVELAAYCGDEGARVAVGNGPHAWLAALDGGGPTVLGVAAMPLERWVRGLQRWADVGRVPGWLPALAAHAGFEVGLRGYQPGRAEVFEAAVETSRRMRAWLGDPGPRTLAFVRAAHDGAGPFASMPFPIRAMLSGVLQFEPGCGVVARQIDPDGMSSAGHVLGWSARNVGEAPVREAIQRSLIAWALSPGEP